MSNKKKIKRILPEVFKQHDLTLRKLAEVEAKEMNDKDKED